MHRMQGSRQGENAEERSSMLIYGTEHERQENERLELKCKYLLYKDAGMCTHCGVKPARIGLTTCEACASHARRYGRYCYNQGLRKRAQKLPPEKYKEAMSERHKERYHALIGKGLCVICRKPQDSERKTYCNACAKKLAEKRKKYYQGNYTKNGKGEVHDENS